MTHTLPHDTLAAIFLGGILAFLCLLAALSFYTDETTIPAWWRYTSAVGFTLLGLAFLASFGWGSLQLALYILGGGNG